MKNVYAVDVEINTLNGVKFDRYTNGPKIHTFNVIAESADKANAAAQILLRRELTQRLPHYSLGKITLESFEAEILQTVRVALDVHEIELT